MYYYCPVIVKKSPFIQIYMEWSSDGCKDSTAFPVLLVRTLTKTVGIHTYIIYYALSSYNERALTSSFVWPWNNGEMFCGHMSIIWCMSCSGQLWNDAATSNWDVELSWSRLLRSHLQGEQTGVPSCPSTMVRKKALYCLKNTYCCMRRLHVL